MKHERCLFTDCYRRQRRRAWRRIAFALIIGLTGIALGWAGKTHACGETDSRCTACQVHPRAI